MCFPPTTTVICSKMSLTHVSTRVPLVIGEESSSAAWLMLRAIVVLNPGWMGAKQRLSRMYNVWKTVLIPRVEAVGKEQREVLEMELRMRSEVKRPLFTQCSIAPTASTSTRAPRCHLSPTCSSCTCSQ